MFVKFVPGNVHKLRKDNILSDKEIKKLVLAATRFEIEKRYIKSIKSVLSLYLVHCCHLVA